MSLDYPDRKVWLAKRNNAVAGTTVYGRVIWTKGTFNVGRTKHKERIWAAKRRERAKKRLLKKAVGR